MASTVSTRDHTTQMAARHSSSGRLARWQPYSLSSSSIPNKKALPCLVRPRLSLLAATPGSASMAQDASASHPSPITRPAQPYPTLAEPAAAKHYAPSEQLPTPHTSPPNMPPMLLQQTSSNYVLELSLAILASVYFQPAYQAAAKSTHLPHHGEADPTSPTAPTLCPPKSTVPVPASRPSPSPTRAGQKEQIAPLTPQSPPSEKPSPPAPSSASLPPPAPVEARCVLPSKSDLARHLNLLGAIGARTSSQVNAPTTGSMRWFLTELFKRAAVPGLIIRVAAGYVLRCRSAIAQALRTVALKSMAEPTSTEIQRTPLERVLTDARRVFLACLVLACKFVFDKPYDNRSWSLISGLGSRDIGECERVVGDVLQWRLWIGAGRSP